jgi:pimeloyl-ACP methyl ester carboxylesterase
MQKNLTLLLIHGGPGLDDSYFFPYLDTLKKDVNILSYQLGTRYKKKDFCEISDLVDELNEVITTIKGDIFILGHSFGACLALSLSNESLDRVKRIILSNWIYDSSWIQLFYDNFPETKKMPKCNNLAEESFQYLPYYFVDLQRGKTVLERISYNDKLQSDLGGYLSVLDLDSKVNDLKETIVSISSDQDKITPHEYIQKITNKFNIKNHNILGAGHFPFVDKTSEYCLVLQELFKEHYEEWIIKK